MDDLSDITKEIYGFNSWFSIKLPVTTDSNVETPWMMNPIEKDILFERILSLLRNAGVQYKIERPNNNWHYKKPKSEFWEDLDGKIKIITSYITGSDVWNLIPEYDIGDPRPPWKKIYSIGFQYIEDESLVRYEFRCIDDEIVRIT